MKKTVLVVDDDPMVRDCLADVLSGDAELVIVKAASAEEALGLIGAGQAFDLLLTDRRMGGIWGDELIRRLRGRGFRQPMVLMTGDARTPALPEADRVLPKPCGIDRLIATVNGLLAA